MAWTLTADIAPGQYIMGDILSGVNLTGFTGLGQDELLSRIAEYARGWIPIQIMWSQGVFGVGESLRVFGRAENANLSSADVAAQISNGINSFWLIGGATTTVYSSSSFEIPASAETSPWAATLQLISLAIILIAGVYIFVQVKKGLS